MHPFSRLPAAHTGVVLSGDSAVAVIEMECGDRAHEGPTQQRDFVSLRREMISVACFLLSDVMPVGSVALPLLFPSLPSIDEGGREG